MRNGFSTTVFGTQSFSMKYFMTLISRRGSRFKSASGMLTNVTKMVIEIAASARFFSTYSGQLTTLPSALYLTALITYLSIFEVFLVSEFGLELFDYVQLTYLRGLGIWFGNPFS
ncbi:hypothetical protein PG997_002909 [Apiospora hydei]|uniref:Uncharacterized protein n=1 Tax=Apiospora hydei TaxID=1337664 RepID=A0ABR1WXU0_9PEZI